MDSMHRVDEFRRGSSEVENNLIDALSAGRISRKEFIRRGTVLGLSLSALSFIASACGGDDDDESATGGTGTTEGQANAGGTLRTGIITPAIELNPLVVYDEGGLGSLPYSFSLAGWPSSASPVSTLPGRTISSSSSRAWPRAGRRTRTARSGRSRSARASRSTTARR